jgi:hypothetical protein
LIVILRQSRLLLFGAKRCAELASHNESLVA